MAPPPSPALADEHEFRGVAGGAATANSAFLDTLGTDGPLLVRDAHVLALMLPNLPIHAAGVKRFDYRRVWFCLLSKVLVFDGATPMVPRPIWLGRFVRTLCEGGMPTVAVADEAALRDLVAEYTLLLTVAQRTLTAADPTSHLRGRRTRPATS